MKTLMTWDSDFTGIKFYWLDGNFSHLDGLYLNQYNQDWKPLLDFVYGPDGTDEFKIQRLEVEKGSIADLIHDTMLDGESVYLVVCGEIE